MEIILHTAPPYRIGDKLHAVPYRHVVGLSIEDKQLWRPDQNFYGPTHSESLQTPHSEFSLRLLQFFDSYLTQRKRRGPEYNCHLFAGFMAGNVELDVTNNDAVLDQADDMARGIVDQGMAISVSLPLGAQGVIGERTDPYVRYIAHSVIGLGEDRDEFLEVDNTYGDLGLQQYRQSVPYYASVHHTNGLYTMPEGIEPRPLGRD